MMSKTDLHELGRSIKAERRRREKATLPSPQTKAQVA